MGDAHHKESESSSIENIIHLKGSWGVFPQRRRPTDTSKYILSSQTGGRLYKMAQSGLWDPFLSVTTELAGLQRLMGWLLQLRA